MCVLEIALAVCSRHTFNLVALVCATKVVIFQAHTDETLVGEDLTDSAQHEDRVPISVPVALVNDHRFWGVVPCADEVAVDPIDKGEYAAMWSQLGKGLCPNHSQRGQDAAGDPNGLDDGEPPAVAFPDASPPINAAVIEAELEMCKTLATWEPWNTPSEALIQAIDCSRRAQQDAQYTHQTYSPLVRGERVPS